MSHTNNTDTTVKLLTVGLPVYNGGQWLEQASDAFLNQTFRHFELIIVDNASTDSTQAICEAFVTQDDRIKYVRNEQNIGLFKNFDKAFTLSSSKYFKWAAVSDFCLPEFFEKCI